MAKVAITESYLEDIADAIREKTGLTNLYYPSQMAPAIMTISGSGGITPTGTISITANGTYNVTQYASASVEVPTGSTISNQNKIVIPTESQQSITYDSGYTGLGIVTVNAIPASYIIPTGNKEIVENGTNIDVTNYATISVAVPTGSTINNQDKTVNPLTSQQTITFDSGYTGLGTVTINAMPVGTAGTPSASKGTVSNHTISVTPSVTNTTGYITGSTKTGIAVTVSASELVSGTLSVTTNGTKDVTNYASINVNVSGDAPVLQSKTYTVSGAGTGTVTADSGYDGLSSVAVSVPSASLYTDINTDFFTENNTRKWRVRGVTIIDPSEGDQEGWIGEGSYYGNYGNYNAVVSNTSITPTELSQTIGGREYMMEGAVTINAIPSNYIGSGITQRSSSDLTVSGATVTVPSGYYSAQASKAVASGTAGTPTATKGTVSNHQVSVTPSVTNTSGYITGSTKTGTAVTVSASELVSGTLTISSSGTKDVTNYASASVSSGSATPASTISATGASVSTGTNTLTLSKSVSNTPQVSAGYISSGTAGNSSVSLTATVTVNPTPTVSGATVTIPGGYYTSQTTKTVSSGTAGTPTATKGTVSNNSIVVTPSVTNTTGWITGSTISGTGVSVSASELVSGSQTITSNDTYDVTNYAEVVVNVSSGGAVTITDEANSAGITCVITTSGGSTPSGIPLNTELIDLTKLMGDYAINSSGEAEAAQYYCVTDYTPVATGMEFSYTGCYWYNLATYDSSKNVIRVISLYTDSTQDSDNTNIGHGTLSGTELPQNVAYIRITGVYYNGSYRVSLIRTA